MYDQGWQLDCVVLNEQVTYFSEIALVAFIFQHYETEFEFLDC